MHINFEVVHKLLRPLTHKIILIFFVKIIPHYSTNSAMRFLCRRYYFKIISNTIILKTILNTLLYRIKAILFIIFLFNKTYYNTYNVRKIPLKK